MGLTPIARRVPRSRRLFSYNEVQWEPAWERRSLPARGRVGVGRLVLTSRRAVMVNPSDWRGLRTRFPLAAALAVACILLTALPSSAQFVISPDRSTVIVGPPPPY